MGLFGKKEYPKVGEVFSPQAIQGTISVLLQKGTAGYGAKYEEWLKPLLDALMHPDSTPDKKGWQQIIFASGMMTKLEPALKPELDAAIKKYHKLV